MVMEYVLFFYMLGIGLVAYIFYEIDQRSKDVPRAKVEHNEEQWEHDPKEKEIKTNKKREGFILLFLLYNPLYLDILLYAAFSTFT
ncbi:hypothetical protein [Priestia megaterium]|uniref:hypothetical protein n=1 Tax=Priestia megaterium TaxID=1404 RepID=UPI00237A6480|nr:hypothetical protein [Priestia megaterium]MDD9791830.1 hypothetical protein [Priestia megaterium]